jgi:phosphoribosylformylglycinamidine synthase
MARIGSAAPGDVIIQIGGDGSHLGQTAWLRDCLGRSEGAPPPVDLMQERRNGDFIRSAIRNGLITACHDISTGGLGLALAEMAISSGHGMEIDLSGAQAPNHALLFGEDQARYVIAVSRDLGNFMLASAEGAGVPFRKLGTVAGDSLAIQGLMSVPVSTLRKTHESWFPSFMDTAAAMAAE